MLARTRPHAGGQTGYRGSIMTNASQNRAGGRLNLLTAGFFTTGADGRKLFFPWGLLTRGYAIPTEAAYERLNHKLKIYMIVMLALIAGSAVSRIPFATVAMTALLIIFYSAWLPSLLRELQPADEKVTLREGMANHARTIPLAILWSAQIGSLLFVAGGVAMFIVDPGQWVIALAPTVFFGFCAATFAIMLVLRRHGEA
jgi:hypothetical protein